jgi:DNA-binding transcriptional LysR family regulator
MEDWNDLRLVLALARARSLPGAAAALGVNHSTAYRRLAALEARLGIRLFDKAAGGYRATEAGQRMAGAAERVEAETLALDRAITGQDTSLSGSLKVTSSETLAYRVLTGLLADFRRQHPGIRVELSIDNRQLDLSRREADVALRATRPTEGDLFGRKVADIAWTIYGSRGYLAEHGMPAGIADAAKFAFIGWEDGARVRAAEWLADAVPAAAVVYRSSSLVNQLVAVQNNIGLAVLPCYLGDPEPDLVRTAPPMRELTRELWLITHSDLRQTARVRAFFDVIGEGLKRSAALLEGRTERASAKQPRTRRSKPPPASNSRRRARYG